MLEPGRELDAAVARHVFGYEFQPLTGGKGYCEHCGRVFQGYNDYYNLKKFCQGRCRYSIDDDAAWAVVRAMREKGFAVSMGWTDDDALEQTYLSVVVFTGTNGRGNGTEKSFPHAVCVATLMALGVEL